MANATELPPLGEMAERSGESLGVDKKTSSRFPPVAHHRSHQRLSNWNTTEITQGDYIIIAKQKKSTIVMITKQSECTLNLMTI